MLPQRTCGGCTVCCKMLPVDSRDFQKQSGVLCMHCDENSGCAIHTTRPAICRSFLCGWRELSFIPEALRPDRCGLLIVADPSDIPSGYRKMPGVKFVVTGGKNVLAYEPFLECLAGLIEGRAPAFLALPGPPGHFFAKAFLNERLAGAVRALDAAAMTTELAAIMDELAKGPFDPVIFA